MIVVINQSNYIPWKGYFDLINDADTFVFYDEVQYTKNDWRNRNKIVARNGLHWLTVPIPKKAVKGKISEARIEDPSWQKKHYESIKQAYGKKPFYGNIADLVDETWLNREWESLSELNQSLIKKIAAMLGCDTQFVDSKDFNLDGDRIERLLNILVELEATKYISGPAARDYLEGSEHLFTDRNIDLEYKDYSGFPEYTQASEPFDHYVSVIDLIANIGLEQSPSYIWGWREENQG